MLALAYVVDFLAHEFACLGRRGLAGTLISTSAFYRFFLRHIHVSKSQTKGNTSAIHWKCSGWLSRIDGHARFVSWLYCTMCDPAMVVLATVDPVKPPNPAVA